jgi:hypothetical protein
LSQAVVVAVLVMEKLEAGVPAAYFTLPAELLHVVYLIQ